MTKAPSSRNSASLSFKQRLDKSILTALMSGCLVYSLVTVVTYNNVSSSDNLDSLTIPTTLQQKRLHRVAKHAIVAPGAAAAAAATSDAVPHTIAELQHTFPIHIGKDVEEIRHPGFDMVDLIDIYGNTLKTEERDKNKRMLPANIPRTLTVPKFFDESHGHIYHNNKCNNSKNSDGNTNTNNSTDCTIRSYLGNGETLMTPELAATIGSVYTDPETGQEMETIYCSIASYRDPECSGTVSDLFERAEFPDRIRVAVIDQRVLGDDDGNGDNDNDDNQDPKCAQPAEPCEQNPKQTLCQYRHLIDLYEVDARLSVGPVFARHLAHRMYRGEYYAMQIDAHVRFTENWDSDIIGQFKDAKNEMAVLSTYPSDITNSIDPITHKNIRGVRPIMCASAYEGNDQYKHLRHGQQPEGKPDVTGEPTMHPFWAAGFSFGRGHFVLQVPYDQYLPMVFQGEEISIGLRGFTYGYDYYAPERSVCFHMYAKFNDERKKVPHFWENSKLFMGTGRRAMRRLNSVIGMTGPNPYPEEDWDATELHKYGLGNVRDKRRFFEVFGIHPETETVEYHLCRFVGRPMMNIFKPALRPNGMGVDYSLIDYHWVDPAPNEPDLRAKPKRGN